MANQDDTKPATQWVEVDNFSAGIFASSYSEFQSTTHTAPQAPLGAAQAVGTEGCVAAPTGALVPGPRWISRQRGVLGTPVDSTNAAQVRAFNDTVDIINPFGDVSLGSSQPVPACTVGSAIISPVADADDLNANYPTPSDTPDLLGIMTWSQIAGRSGTSPATGNLPTSDDVNLFTRFAAAYMGATDTGVQAKGIYHGQRWVPVAGGDLINEPVGQCSVAQVQSAFGVMSVTPTISTTTGTYPFIFFGASPWMADSIPAANNFKGYLMVMPDPNTGSATPQGPAELFGSAPVAGVNDWIGAILATHQGRIVWANRSRVGVLPYPTGTNTTHFVQSHVNDVIQYNENPFGPAIDASLPPTASYLVDGTGVAIIVSIDANTLLVIKTRGGGYLVRGDLDRPQVTRLSGITSTLGKNSIPAITPLGAVYGARDGMFAWGSATSASSATASSYLSAQLPGTFWTSDVDWPTNAFAPETPLGKFNYRQPYILCPSDFLFDTRTKAFWKLRRDQPRVHNSNANTVTGYATWGYEVSATGNVYAITTHRDFQDDTYWNYYDFTNPAIAYTWTSQPIPMVKDRNMVIREIGAKIEGIGSVTVDLIGRDGEELGTATFTTTTNSPTTVRANVTADLYNGGEDTSSNDVVVRITAGSGSTTTGAPIVHSFRLGVQEAQSIPITP